jgi:hypothetical protein
MAVGRKPCFDITRTVKMPSVELLCLWIKPWQWISLEKKVRRHKDCCISDGMEDEEEVGNVGSEHDRVNSECET